MLRGRLPRPSLKDLPKRFAPLPPEGDDHYAYSLGKVKIHGPSFPVFGRFGPRGRGASGNLRCRVLLGQQVPGVGGRPFAFRSLEVCDWFGSQERQLVVALKSLH